MSEFETASGQRQAVDDIYKIVMFSSIGLLLLDKALRLK